MDIFNIAANTETSTFNTPPNTPFSFSISILKASDRAYIFNVEDTPSKKKFEYVFNKDHQSYLDFFEKLAKQFNMRVPQNRQNKSFKTTFKATYKEVLTQNLTSEILYGYGDPSVIRVDRNQLIEYFLLATSNDAPNAFPILRSNNLVEWEFVDFVFPKGKKPKWAADGELVSDFWAPEMHFIENEFRVYFVAREKNSRELCIGMARSEHPAGPFVAEKEPILKGNVIDPHIFVADNHTSYLFWKEDNNDIWPGCLLDLLYAQPKLISTLFKNQQDQSSVCFILSIWPWAKNLEPMERFQAIQVLIEAVTSQFMEFYDSVSTLLKNENDNEDLRAVLKFMKTPMYAQQLTEDGTKLIGERVKILENDLKWEAHLVEGMWVTKHLNKYYLFYAGNDFSTEHYGIGVAIADSPLGPYTKMPKQLLQSTAEWRAPGHPSVTIAPDGKTVMLLHAYFPGKAGYKEFRALLAINLIFEENGVRIES